MVKTIISLVLLFLSVTLHSQAVNYSYFYRITFRDKGSAKVSDYAPQQLLSVKAIERRIRTGIPVLEYSDLPVNSEYLKKISESGLTLHCTSKWMNSALFKSSYPVDAEAISVTDFVKDVKIVRKPGTKGPQGDKLSFRLENSPVYEYDRPITMLNGYALHDQGFEGSGVLIAVLDGGFDNSEEITSLEGLRDRDGIITTHDFVRGKQEVYGYSTHGTAVLSILAGSVPWVIEGTAKESDYLLLITEDPSTEYPCEEDYWAAGAEYADSAGADIITSSLGYSTFDDPSMNHLFSDLDGDKTFITEAADIAAHKGIIIVNSAGNERNKVWKRIICPADGDSVIAVGAVDGENVISSFSSAGPSYDRRIKPDVVAMGVAIPLQVSNTSIGTSNGTSFSCPVISGMTACLLQAVPEAKNSDIIRVLKESSDRYLSPDSLYGYGIPDMGKALLRLQNMFIPVPSSVSVAGPNPTTGEFEIIFKEPYESLITEIYTTTGKLIWKHMTDHFAGRSVKINALNNYPQGLYIVRIKTSSDTMTHKIIKVKE